MTARLIVDELPAGYTRAQLRTLFASYGTVVSAVVVAGPLGESLRFGYVEMTTMERRRERQPRWIISRSGRLGSMSRS